MFSEILQGYNRSIGAFEIVCPDVVCRRIAAGMRRSASAMATFASDCDRFRRRCDRIRERVEQRRKKTKEIQSQLSRICGGEYGQRRQREGYYRQDGGGGQRRGFNPSPQRQTRPRPEERQPRPSPVNGNPKPQIRKPIMSEKDKVMTESFRVQFAAVGNMERELVKAETVVSSIYAASKVLKEVTAADTRLKQCGVVENRELEYLKSELDKALRIQRAVASLVRAAKSSSSMLDGMARESSEIKSEINKLKPLVEDVNKKWHGFSGMARRALSGMKNSLAMLAAVDSPRQALQKKAGTLEYEAQRMQERWDAEVVRRKSAYSVGQTSSEERDKVISQKNSLMSDMARCLSALSGRAEGTLVSKKSVEDGKTILEFSSGTDPRSIMRKALADSASRLSAVAEACRGIQRDFARLGLDDMNESSVFPSHVILGEMCTDIFGMPIKIPCAVGFPFEKPILFDDESDLAVGIVRILYALPAGKTLIAAIDHETAGDNAGMLNALCGECELMRLATSVDDATPILRGLDEYMGRMSRQVFSYRESNWAQYNANHPEDTLPLRILAVYSLSNISQTQLELVKKILENGSKFGIVCMMARQAIDRLEPRLRDRFKGVDVERIAGRGRRIEKHPRLELKMCDEASVSARRLGELSETYVKKYAESAAKPKREIKFISLFEDIDFWAASSGDGLSAPIGWETSSGEVVNFEFGVGRCASAYHALVGGTTGSGKSVFLHTLIQSLAAKYSPDELLFYLLDYKKGDEFKKYADQQGNAWLPHARMISRHKDPRFALELFDFLDKEFKRRSELFGSYGDIVAFRRNGGKVPRIVVVIDEFQVMFEEYCGLNLSDEVAKRLSTVFKQGRSYGVHVVLATQSLASLHFSGMAGILGQIGLRIALKGTASDGILADGNRAAENIIPKRQCVVNPAFGLRDSEDTVNNIVTDVPFSDPAQVEECKKIRKLIEIKSRQMRLRSMCRVFNGAALPVRPDAMIVREAMKPKRWNTHFSLLFGARTDFASTPLAVEFLHEQREHLLVAGEDGNLSSDFEVKITGEDVWLGVRRGIIESLDNADSCDVLYYNPGVRDVPSEIPDYFMKLGGMAKEADVLRALKELIRSKCERKVVIVENFQDARLIHPGEAPRPSFSSRPSATTVDSDSARTLFASAFNGTDEPKFHVILLTKNFNFMNKEVLSRSGAEANILKGCGKRIAFNLSDDDLGTMIPHLKSQDRRGPRRVWFEDMRTGSVLDFLPYEK